MSMPARTANAHGADSWKRHLTSSIESPQPRAVGASAGACVSQVVRRMMSSAGAAPPVNCGANSVPLPPASGSPRAKDCPSSSSK